LKALLRIATAAVATTLFAVACSQASSSSPPASGTASPPPASTSGAPTSKAADLRTKLDLLLGEHLILASKATGAALGGRMDEYKSYADLLNQNGSDLGSMIGAAYGSDAESTFNQIWSAHNGFFVDYTIATAKKDSAGQQKAVDNLTNVYVPQFSDFIASATGLDKATVTSLTKDHVLQTKQIVDDQAAGNWDAVYPDIRKAYAHMQMIGDPVAEAIAQKMPDKFPGDGASKAVDLRVALNQLLQEHLYLATFATDAALGGRNAEFSSAGNALNQNGTDLGAAIGSLYGADAQSKFNQIWSAHNGFFVDYTTGVAKNDAAAKDKAVSDLTTVYVPQFSEFIAGATGLDKTAVANLTMEHVVTTKNVVDAQGAKDVQGAAKDDRLAAQHMEMIADPLASAIVAKLPQKFQ
jgi:hypothetical protein